MTAAEPVRTDRSGPRDPVDLRVERARRAAAEWSERSIRARARVLRRARHLLAERAEAIAQAVAVVGRTHSDTLSAEILPLLDAMRFAERRAASVLAPRRPSTRDRPRWLGRVDLEIVREPWGVVLVIGPSNYPLSLAAIPCVQALAAGNAVLVKPGAGGGRAVRRFVDALREAGVPDGVVQCLDESPDDARRAIAAGVDRVVLTGSATTGRAVLRSLAEPLTPSAMELSGCDAVFVLPGADLALAARALRFGVTLNAGATCIAPRRVFVPRDLADALERRLAETFENQRAVAVPPESAARAHALVDDAVARGARVLVGGTAGDDGMTPVVLVDVVSDARILHEDPFAPVLAVVRVRDREHALASAAACPYALGAVVFGPESDARRLASRIDAGVVVINDVVVPTADPRLPFGGRRASGFGTTRGAEGLVEMTRPKAVSLRRGNFRPHLDPPVGVEADLFESWIRMAHGCSWAGRARAARRWIRALLAAARGARAGRGTP